ncbi:hypothetical protein BPOR_0051g00100 [Botrytis porri]|uniref:Uncharacterized protein n=1 Tax=Botrytis porri TaxID=87229 RepID=A0A4Z1L1V2_9HELO|nr:hypothetical protein BPOR_0051g00100 [Botrytis porri]
MHSEIYEEYYRGRTEKERGSRSRSLFTLFFYSEDYPSFAFTVNPPTIYPAMAAHSSSHRIYGHRVPSRANCSGYSPESQSPRVPES